MGRLGKLPVKLPEGVKIEVANRVLSVTGPKGELSRNLPRKVAIKVKDGSGFVEKKGDSKLANALQGTFRSHLSNMVHGVTEGWKKELEINGPGFRAEAKPKEIVLSVGYSHPVIIKAPENIEFKVEKNLITVEGIDKEVVGHVAAMVRNSRKPNPYTGSGIKYVDEVIRRKPGKQAGVKAE